MIEKYAELVLDSVFDAIIVVNKDYFIIDANKAALDLGYTIEKLKGTNINDLIDETTDNFVNAMNDVIAQSERGIREVKRFRFIKPDKSILYMDVTVKKIESDDGIDYILSFHDVTERFFARKELEDQKARLEEVFKETERLKAAAEESNIKLNIANEQLEKRQAVTEAALQKEQELRLTSEKTGYQKMIVGWMIVLIAFVMLLPYITGLISVSDKAVEGSVNNMPLLIQILGIGIGAMFGQQMEKQSKQ